MDNSFVFNETNYKRIPEFLVLIIVLLLVIPYLGMYIGMDFSTLASEVHHNSPANTQLVESEIRGYFRQILLQWSGCSVAAVAVLLSYTQYKLTNDKVALIIGVVLLFSGMVDALHIILVDGLVLKLTAKTNLDALIWTLSNSIEAVFFIGGLLIVLTNKKEILLNNYSFIALNSLIITLSLVVVYGATHLASSHTLLFANSLMSRPYELISGILYSALLAFIYPQIYKKYPRILTNSICYIALTQIVISLYLMFLSHTSYDSAYNIAYFLKLIVYGIPCICLLTSYIHSYYDVLIAQKRLKIKQEELKYISSHDPLTNLFNRREFEELLEKTIANSLRNKSSMALFIIDLDNFKATNDTFGHVHGDELLKQFSNRLVVLIRKGDTLARIGGDEFALISPNIKNPSSARHLAERILNELNSPYLINDKLITVTVSIGIAIFPDDGRNSEKLLIKADLALYKSKTSGKNTYQFYTAQLSHLQHRESEIEAHLRKAIQLDEFELYFQPIYNLLNKQIVGAEVLLRWSNQTLGNISPNTFIPVAERSGLIIDIGYWVIRNTCEQITFWKQHYNCSLSFSLNISPVQLVHNQFISTLEKILTECNCLNEFLEFEITESILMGYSTEILQVINSIYALGIKISLDDFGKEYSSLNRIKTIPIDTLKIDRDFVSDITSTEEKVAIVDIIIKLANELGMNIVAEGIETIEQLNYLVAKKCYLGQGFLLSHPLTAEQFSKLAFSDPAKKMVNLL